MINSISLYIQAVDTIYQTGETTEHSFRGALETLLNTFCLSPQNSVPIQIINEPKRKEYGAPDLSCVKGRLLSHLLKQKTYLIRI